MHVARGLFAAQAWVIIAPLCSLLRVGTRGRLRDLVTRTLVTGQNGYLPTPCYLGLGAPRGSPEACAGPREDHLLSSDHTAAREGHGHVFKRGLWTQGPTQGPGASPRASVSLSFLICEGGGHLPPTGSPCHGGRSHWWPGAVGGAPPRVLLPPSSPLPRAQPHLPSELFSATPTGGCFLVNGHTISRSLGLPPYSAPVHLPQFLFLDRGRIGGPGCFTARGAGRRLGQVSTRPGPSRLRAAKGSLMPCGSSSYLPLCPNLSPPSPRISGFCFLPFLVLFLVPRHSPCSRSPFNFQPSDIKCGQRAQHVQRPWGRTVPGMLEEQ